LRRPDQNHNGKQLKKEEEKMTGKKKILIVDDEPDFISMLKMRLEAGGYDIISASDGREGLQKAQKETPNLILLDILMPEKDGYTTLRELREKKNTKSIPIIVLTAKPEMKELFEMEGIKDYILKPFDNNDLLIKIKKALNE